MKKKYKYSRRSHYRKLKSGKKVLVRGFVKGHKSDKTKTGYSQDRKKFNIRQKHERSYRGVKKAK